MSNPGLLIYRRAPSKPSLEQTATRGHCFLQASVTLASDASSSSSQCEPGGRNLADNHKGESTYFSFQNRFSSIIRRKGRNVDACTALYIELHHICIIINNCKVQTSTVKSNFILFINTGPSVN